MDYTQAQPINGLTVTHLDLLSVHLEYGVASLHVWQRNIHTGVKATWSNEGPRGREGRREGGKEEGREGEREEEERGGRGRIASSEGEATLTCPATRGSWWPR